MLTDLQRNIEAELRELEGESGRQLRLQFTNDDERVQLDRDLAALRQRLEEIPGEIDREQQAIRSRYSSPQYPAVPRRGHVRRAAVERDGRRERDVAPSRPSTTTG